MAEERVQRRLAAILAVDVVGYSRLMGHDETGTLAALKAHRKELIDPNSAEYHGRIVKLTGDGTLMEFGSAVDAVLFAVDVQRAIVGRNAEVPEDRRITYRMGINIGDIIIDGDDIYGDGVNVAARLEGLADPGGIRNVFVGLRYKDLLQQGYKDPGREWADEAVTMFVKSHKRNITFYFDGADSHLAKVYTLTAASASPLTSRHWMTGSGYRQKSKTPSSNARLAPNIGLRLSFAHSAQQISN